jgi:hypothetical protein
MRLRYYNFATGWLITPRRRQNNLVLGLRGRHRKQHLLTAGLLAAGIIVLGLNLRAVITSLPPVFPSSFPRYGYQLPRWEY